MYINRKNNYKVYDSCDNLVRGNFSTYIEAFQYKQTFGNYNWYIK